MKNQSNIDEVLEFLKLHHEAFFQAAVFAEQTQHPTPTDTRAYSQIVVSLLCGVKGLKRKDQTWKMDLMLKEQIHGKQ